MTAQDDWTIKTPRTPKYLLDYKLSWISTISWFLNYVALQDESILGGILPKTLFNAPTTSHSVVTSARL